MKEVELLKRIGLNIKKIRMNKGISQQDLAASCNFEKSNMCRIESGKTNFTVKTLYLISKSLNVPISEIVSIDFNEK